MGTQRITIRESHVIYLSKVQSWCIHLHKQNDHIILMFLMTMRRHPKNINVIILCSFVMFFVSMTNCSKSRHGLRSTELNAEVKRTRMLYNFKLYYNNNIICILSGFVCIQFYTA